MFKKLFAMLVVVATTMFSGMFFTSCSNEDGIPLESVSTRASKPVVTIPAGAITTNTTWSNANDYRLDGKVYVSNNATLTIEAGTTIKGVYYSAAADASALIITRGSQLIANGNAASPIVFTAENGTKGGWGGLVLLGNARINQSADYLIEGLDPDKITIPAGVVVTYGTNVDTYNTESSGSLQYVRVEYAGAAIAANNELNSFTFGGVGSGTTLNHLQAYEGADDAFEFFGGRANASYLVSTSADDDAFDFDFGYQGKLQFLLSTINSDLSYSSNPNGIECDNDGTGTGATPYTHPELSNLTVRGTVTGASSITTLKAGAHFRRNTQLTLRNSIFYGFPTGIQFENVNTTGIDFSYNVVSGVTTNFSGFTAGSTNNGVAVASIQLTTPWDNWGDDSPLRPASGSYAYSGANFTGLTGFTATTYKGAIDPTGTNWVADGIDSWIRADY